MYLVILKFSATGMNVYLIPYWSLMLRCFSVWGLRWTRCCTSLAVDLRLFCSDDTLLYLLITFKIDFFICELFLIATRLNRDSHVNRFFITLPLFDIEAAGKVFSKNVASYFPNTFLGFWVHLPRPQKMCQGLTESNLPTKVHKWRQILAALHLHCAITD